MQRNKMFGLVFAALGCLGSMGALWHLRRGEKEGRFYYGRQHRYVMKGEAHYSGLVTNHKLMLGFFVFFAGLGVAVSLRQE